MSSPDISELFAGLTALIEDMHGIVMEGRGADLTVDMARGLAGHVRTGLSRGEQMVKSIEAALP